MRHASTRLFAISLLCVVSCSDQSPTQPQTLTVQARPHDCGAVAHRDGDRLDVQFTLSMQMNDFMNGVYIKAPH